MKIVVTGGLGFIGSHTVVELQQKGYEVVIIDNCSNSTPEVLQGINSITGTTPHFEQFDLRDKARVIDFFERHNDCAGLIHFAASKAVGESVQQPLAYYENNISTLIYILQQLTALTQCHFIFSSSCTVYGQAKSLPITEDADVQPAASPYGNTKQIGEEIIKDACAVHSKLSAISLRYFNPIGAHPSACIGELPLGVPQNLVPYITQTAIGLRKELSVFGDTYDTPDGTAVRDYIHVVDLAKAHVVALERLLKQENDGNYEVFNVGTGTGSSVLEVISAFERVSNQKLPYKIVAKRAGDVTAAFADTTKAQHILGWTAQYSLDDAMADAWRWEQKIRASEQNS